MSDEKTETTEHQAVEHTERTETQSQPVPTERTETTTETTKVERDEQTSEK